jgi:hypothetical protein
MPHPDGIAHEASSDPITDGAGRPARSFMVGMAVSFPRGETPVPRSQHVTDELGQRSLGAAQLPIGQGQPDDLRRPPGPQDRKGGSGLGRASLAQDCSYGR